jgi:hypothetical protein
MTMGNIAQLRWRILLALIGVALVSSLVAVLLGAQTWDGLLLNLGTEMAGAVVTYALLELVIGRRERREVENKALKAKKGHLIAQLGSEVRGVVVAAAEELRQYGWLYDGSLRGSDLTGADMHGVDLSRASLSGVNLHGANLAGANLFVTELQAANLHGANLSGANLHGTNMTGAELLLADLSGANLLGANLYGANLLGADLHEADLRGAKVTAGQLTQAKSLEGATMPDGTVHD